MKRQLQNITLFVAISTLLFSTSCKKAASNREPDPVPTISTKAISSITGSRAMSGGVAAFPGGTSISARGVCWATKTAPTLADNKTTDSLGIGSFTSAITGLTANTTYFVRAYASYAQGTVYGNELSFKTTDYSIGDAYQCGIIAYVFQSGDPGYIAGAFHGLIAAPSDQSLGSAWGCDLTAIAGADGTALGTGNQNTIDIQAGCATAGIAARLCGSFVLGAYSDWYLPSKDELNKLYLNKAAIGGFSNNAYWTSSESDAGFSFVSYFNNGTQGINSKSTTNSVRAIRTF